MIPPKYMSFNITATRVPIGMIALLFFLGAYINFCLATARRVSEYYCATASSVRFQHGAKEDVFQLMVHGGDLTYQVYYDENIGKASICVDSCDTPPKPLIMDVDINQFLFILPLESGVDMSTVFENNSNPGSLYRVMKAIRKHHSIKKIADGLINLQFDNLNAPFAVAVVTYEDALEYHDVDEEIQRREDSAYDSFDEALLGEVFDHLSLNDNRHTISSKASSADETHGPYVLGVGKIRDGAGEVFSYSRPPGPTIEFSYRTVSIEVSDDEYSDFFRISTLERQDNVATVSKTKGPIMGLVKRTRESNDNPFGVESLILNPDGLELRPSDMVIFIIHQVAWTPEELGLLKNRLILAPSDCLQFMLFFQEIDLIRKKEATLVVFKAHEIMSSEPHKRVLSLRYRN